MPFTSCGGCLKDIFITEAEIIDRYVGNQLWGWGATGLGLLGIYNTSNQSSPVQTISAGTNWKQVSATSSQTAAIKTDGTLWMWGSNVSGSLGRNAGGASSSPVQTVSAGTNWKEVISGLNPTVAAIKTDGTLWMWGSNTDGRLGTNSTVNQSSPVQTVSAGTNWKKVCIGLGHAAAIKTDGTLWLWGRNDTGQLGRNDLVTQSSPVQTVSGGTNWKQVSLGWCHSGAIKTDGTLWMWGDNSNFAPSGLGDNTATNRSSPVQTVSGGTNWKQVALGSQHTSAIKTDGTLWGWGNGSTGALGRNNNTSVSSPVQTITGGTNWKQVSVGNGSTAAVKTDGTLWVFGTGTSGRLGHNAATNASSPVQTASGGTNWKQVSLGDSNGAAVTFTES